MKAKFLFFLLTFGICFGMLETLSANNIKITPLGSDKEMLNKTIYKSDTLWAIEFNLTWDNSWKSNNPKNHDAAWIFAKYSLDGSTWAPIYFEDTTSKKMKPTVKSAKGAKAGESLATVSGNIKYVFAPGKSYIPELKASRNVGLFLYRKDLGYGSVAYNQVIIPWDYRAVGIANDDPVSVKVFAIEMVYIPDGAFYLGSGGSENNHFRQGASNDPYRVGSEDSIYLSMRGASKREQEGLAFTSTWGDLPTDTNVRYLPSAYPKGYKAFYMMKYEVTQEAYVDFLNTLNISQQQDRTRFAMTMASVGLYFNGSTGSGSIAYRNGVMLYSLTGKGTFVCNLMNDGKTEDKVNQTDDGQNISMNHMNLMDFEAYLAWSGLRPLTELEFEKAARGTLQPVVDEFVWGSNSGAVNGPIDLNSGKENEGSSTAGANGNFSCEYPSRAGCYADSATTRMGAGAGYYGNMDLSGNMMENLVGIHYLAGRKFTGLHGTGVLDPNTGRALPELGWPGVNTGYIFKGCYSEDNHSMSNATHANYYRLSDRYWNGGGLATSPSWNYGIRGGRTAVCDR